MTDSIHPIYTNDNYLSSLAKSGIYYYIISTPVDIENIHSNGNPQIYLIDSKKLDSNTILEAIEKCSHKNIPILLLMWEIRADLSHMKFDDFIVMPSNNFELLTRVKKLISYKGTVSDPNSIHARGLTINKSNYEVTVHNRRIPLRFKEYEMLVLMASNIGKVYSREDLLSQIWGYDYFGGIRTVDVHIRRLRSKIEDGENIFIETVWNVGYRFKN